MEQMTATYGKMDQTEAEVRLVSVFHGQGLDWIMEGTRDARSRWHNLKYYTWVEQQGKTVKELDAQLSREWWVRHQERVSEIDKRIKETRGS
jgi:hypothetical protein